MPRQIPAIVAATALAGSAMAQQQPGRFEVMDCFGGTTGGPSPAPEPGVVQGCTHLTGEMRLANR